ncbi:MAG: acetate--CoA ligase family protein [Burkholderiales bacterium]|nr:acetate--CoA ligase family protein [Burkholderiales bacterium]
MLQQILNPQSVAVIGASADTLKFGGRVIRYVVDHGFAGRIVPVNPSAREVCGIPAFASIGAAPGPIDVAVLAVPTPYIAPTLEECGAMGVKCAVVITADYAEVGDEGKARQDELVAIARRHGIRLIGPNCLGFINPHLNLALTSSVALAPKPMPKGDIGVVSQSGSVMASMISNARDVGAGVSVAASIGNQADLELCDFLDYFAADPRTRAIAVYAEGLRDAQRFIAAARRCREAGKPLVIAKSGASEAGSRLTQSHTASLAGTYPVFEAACRDEAICLVDDPERAVMAAHVLARFAPPAGDCVAVLSPSGGTVAVAADRVTRAGIRIADLTPATEARLRNYIPATRPLNPLEFGGLATSKSFEVNTEALGWLRADPNVAAVLLAAASAPQVDEKIKRWGEIALAGDKPVVLLLCPGSLVDKGRDELRRLGCPFTNRMDDAVGVLRAVLDYGERVRRVRREPERPPDAQPAARLLDRFAPGTLTEHEAKSLLAAVGLTVTREQQVTNAHEAGRAASALGFPVALKAVSRQISHKSDAGGVALDLHDEQAVRAAAVRIAAAVEARVPGAALEGLLVQEMAQGEIEAIVGSRWDAQFGAVAMVGLGGIYVELLHDVQLALAPVSPTQAMALLQALKGWPLLAGARGRGRLDVEALADALVRVSWLAHELGPRLLELDANPVLVRRSGEGVIAVDARATLA